jgi:predicted Rossmann fold flavoprotein
MLKKQVIIIGAGAAGLMCAIEAGKRGREVLVIDHANKAGKKILMSGGGRCNFTNFDVMPKNFISHNPKFCKSALSRYTPADFIKLVESYDIPYHEKTLGQLFCDNKSKDILNMLLAECDNAGATIQLKTEVTNITKHEDGFVLETDNKTYQCQSLVIASGGLSIPTMGAGPFGYKIAEQFGIKVWPTRAGLVPFTLHEHDKNKFEALSGVSASCSVTCNKQSFAENLLFTHRGVSGPAMLQISSYWHPGDEVQVKLYPEDDLLEFLKGQHQQKVNTTLKKILTPLFPNSLIQVWLDEVVLTKKLQDCSFKVLADIARKFQNWHLKPNATEGYRTAEVTLGGVDCDAISSQTFEAADAKGLYFIGEVLDVTGWLGGYNFQWAWASGFAAGQVV